MKTLQLLLPLLLVSYLRFVRTDVKHAARSDNEDRKSIAPRTTSQTTDQAIGKLKLIIQDLSRQVKSLADDVRSQTGTIREQGVNIKALRGSLANKLRENELKVEWALTDGTLTPKNTSGIMEELAEQKDQIDQALKLMREVHSFTFIRPSCADARKSGVHTIVPGKKVSAFCDMSNGGGWTIIQKRFDGSVDFYRGWEDYAEGFGDPAGEYWLGLRHIHALTSAQPMQLYIGITDFDLGLRFAKYDSFSVSSEDENFVLRVGTYFGDAEDCMTYHNAQPFSTKDHDFTNQCATGFHGAWWYNNCLQANLNARFSKVEMIKTGGKYMMWYRLHYDNRALKASVMMIKPVD